MKVCTKCKQEKLLSEFSVRTASPDGYQPLCKECKNKWAAARWQDLILGPILRARALAKYHDLSLEEKDILNKKKYWDNREKNLAMAHRYRRNNKEKVALMDKEKMRKRRKNSPQFRLSDSMSSLMRFALQYNNLSKNNTTWKKLAGYTEIELQNHLELLFTEGMAWDNYGRGGWTIDHIIPISFFQFTSSDDVEFKMCWRLENLRPMWAMDNIMKSNKITRVA